MEGILAGNLGHVLVHDNASGFQSFRAQLLLLTRAQVNAQGEFVDRSVFATNIVNF